MNSSTNRPRRKRGKPSSSDNNDGDIYVPSSSRSNYNMNRDGPSAHVDSQERFYKHSSDAHHRSSRDEYDATDSKDADQWNAHKGGREWSPREFEHSHTSLRRGDGQGWGTSTFNDDRPHPDHESPDWRRGDQDDERGGKWDNKESRGRGSRRWQSDKGWDTRKRDRNQNRRPLDNPDESATPKEDRFWEPGPGWQSRGADQGHRNQRPRNNVQGKNKGKKQVQNRQRQRGDKDRDRGRFPDRDRRQNEDTLNNWQRREIHPLPPKPRSPVKRALTPSRSRSRTPDSFYSRRSSRSRSRSRSYSPRPNAYHSSPPRARSPSPPGRRWGANRSRSPASSQRSHSQRGRPRRRSISSFSSYSGSRSRSSSRSADDRPKAKHRLPPATSIKDISLSISKTSLQQRSEFLNSREPDSNRNGKVYTNGKQRNHRPLPSEAERRANLEMPPPSDAHSITTSRVQQSDSSTSPVSQRHEVGSPAKARFGFSRSAGFKPIGQASSSVKMFFPQDDEESETRRSPLDADSPPRPEIPIKRARKDTSTERGEDDRESTHRFVSVQQDELVWHSKETGIEPPPPPPLVLRDATKAPLSPKHARSGDITTSPGLQTRLPEQEVDGVTRPSSPTPSPKELYAIVSQVGEGTFGKVYKARNTITSVHVALKRIRMEAEKDGFPVTAMREIKLLQSLRHQNVVRLYEMMVSNGSVFMVFEYMDHDLTGVLSQTQFSFSEANLKSLCSQMLAGLAYLHHKGVIHRDIKGSNILINNRGELKLADFGLARFYQKRRRSDYTNRVITLWYRPPELLFGATVYGPEVDMWSAGCIMLELFTKKPVFQGNDEIHQLEVIYRIFGTPTTDRWPGITELPWYELVKPKEAVPDHFRELFQKWLSPAALDLAERLLTYDPTKRVTALQALEAPYFTVEQPPPELPIGLSSLEGEWHELETKRERAKKRRKLENSLQQHVA